MFKGGKVEIGRFKGLGEMMPAQLKETTMDPKKRTLLRVAVLDEARESTGDTVERLMGNKPEARFAFISERAAFAEGADLDIYDAVLARPRRVGRRLRSRPSAGPRSPWPGRRAGPPPPRPCPC